MVGSRCERGAAGVEHVALVLLVAVLGTASVLAVRSIASSEEGRSLGSEIARKTRCAVHHPRPCWQNPLTEAYGRTLAGTVRALAPAPEARIGPEGLPLVGVDYRACKRAGCAVPQPGPRGRRLTQSNRRTTAFVHLVADERRSRGTVTIDYWVYRPTIGWERVTRVADRETIAATARTTLHQSIDPKLVPLETRLGRDDSRFPAGEAPPWRGKVESRWGA